MMGHSVEGRFPFLDYRVIEFANTLPPKYKLRALTEKYILKKTYADLLPQSIMMRAKQPYRAPIHRCFVGEKDNVASKMISREAIEAFGYFDPERVETLKRKSTLADGSRVGERDDMALVGIVSMQLLHHHFIEGSGNRYARAVGPQFG